MLVDRSRFALDEASKVLLKDGLTFQGGVMDALVFLLRRYRKKAVDRTAENLHLLGRQLINFVCTSMIDDLIFNDSARSREQLAALQDLLPVDLLLYIDAVTEGHVGVHPAFLFFVSRLYHVNIQIWNGAVPEQPPLLLGSQPINKKSLILNLIHFPPQRSSDPKVANIYRYGRWAVATAQYPAPSLKRGRDGEVSGVGHSGSDSDGVESMAGGRGQGGGGQGEGGGRGRSASSAGNGELRRVKSRREDEGDYI